MAPKSTTRRTSSLAGQSPVTVAATPPAAAAPAIQEAQPAPAAAMPSTSTAPATAEGKKKRAKITYYLPSEIDEGRLRAAFYAARNDRGWRNMTDMHIDHMLKLVEQLEETYNGGEQFEPMPAGTGPVGRPLS